MTTDPTTRPPLDETRLAEAPGVLAADASDEAVRRWLGSVRVEVVAEAPSTNAVVTGRAVAGEPEGLVVVTEHQTAGRGRLDRTWETPARAALTFSVLLRPRVPAASWPWLPLLTGVAVSGGLRGAGFGAGLKWPNDVLLGERKVAGILVERVDTPGGAAAVVGVGINVSTTAAELPVETATSLALAADRSSGQVPDRTALLLDLLRRLGSAYVDWQEGGGQAAARLHAAYVEQCSTVGRTVSVSLPARDPVVGVARGIDRDGRLEVAGPDGPLLVGAGDVVHVRPVGTSGVDRRGSVT